MNSNTQITLPNFLLVINFRHPMKIVIFRYQNRQKVTKTDSNPPAANNYYSRTAPSSRRAPSSISWLFSRFSCVFVQGYSLFANAQWLISKNLVIRNWPSSQNTEQLHSHLANHITPICNMGCVGSVDSREKQNRWGWWWMWCPPPAIFMVFLNLSLK